MKLRFTLAALIVIAACTNKKPILDDSTVAIIGDHTIQLEDYKKRYIDFIFESGMKDNLVSRRQVAENHAHEILLRYYDENEHIDSNEEYTKELAWAESQMILAYLKDKQVYDNINVSDQEIRQAFERSKEKLAARHLFARDKESAQRLYDALIRGADFNELAFQSFTDSTLKHNGGYLGYFTWGEMDPSFEEVAYSLKPGQISQPVKTSQGFSIIKLEDRIPHPLITESEYQNKKDDIERLLRISHKSKAEENYVNSVFDKESLEFHDKGLELVSANLFGSITNREKLPFNEKVYTYKDKSFNTIEVFRKINSVPSYHRANILDPAMIKATIQGLVIKEELLKQARELGYDENPEVINAISDKQNIAFLKFKRNEIILNAELQDSSLLRFYEKHIDRFTLPEMINVYEIVVSDKKQAKDIIERLHSGSNFSNLARQHSLRKWSAERGGEIGLSELNRFGNLKSKLWNANLDKIVGPLYINGFYGIFKVTEKREATPAEFSDVRQEVEKEYRLANSKEITQSYLRKKYDKIDFRINYPLVRNMMIEQNESN